MAWWQVGMFFLEVGSVIYGGGYVLIAILEGSLVRDYGWLTQSQLIDAVAVGQITPGPVFTTATFIGYFLTARRGDPAPGLIGALAGTVGIFLPSFVFVAVLSRFIPYMRRWPWTASFLDSVNMASVALMAVVFVKLSQQTLTDWPAVLIAAVSVLLLVLVRVTPLWLVLGAATLGWLLRPGI